MKGALSHLEDYLRKTVRTNPHFLLKFINVKKEIFMTTKFTKCLVLSALAIGMSSTVMADENTRPEAQCNNATLKGRYLIAATATLNAVAGELYFYGDGTGKYNVTIKQSSADKPDINRSDTFKYSKDSFGDCHFVLHTKTPPSSIGMYSSLSGDTIALVQGHEGDLIGAVAYYIYRDK